MKTIHNRVARWVGLALVLLLGSAGPQALAAAPVLRAPAAGPGTRTAFAGPRAGQAGGVSFRGATAFIATGPSATAQPAGAARVLQGDISRVEYFIDADPGLGNGTAVPVTAGPNVANVTFSVSLSGLTAGFHRISTRVRDAGGVWSLTNTRSFYFENLPTTPPALANITKVEYFIDADPGLGNGVNVPVPAPGTTVSGLSFSVDLSGLQAGFHRISTRSRDANGVWSLTNTRSFYFENLPTTPPAPANIVRVEYFFDTDPGYGSATSVPVPAPAPNLPNLSFAADASALADGPHRLFVRSRDAAGKWSLVLNRAFTKNGCASSLNLAAGRPSASYSGSGLGATVAESIFNNTGFNGGGPYDFQNNFYAQADLGTPQTVSAVQLRLRNVNGTAVSYTLQVETSADLSTWTTADSYASSLPAVQAAPVLVARTFAPAKTNVRGVRLRLLLPAGIQNIQLTNAGVFFFNCAGPTITSFAPASGPAGTVVTITGTNLGGATAVRFNGVAAGAITNNTATGLTVTAPAGGSTGQICVTTPIGVACSAQNYVYPLVIATGSVPQGAVCAGQSITVPFSTTTAAFAANNVFNFQLSNASGVFAASAPLLGTLSSSSATGGSLNGVIPINTPGGTGYRVRVVASNPAVVGTDNGANLTINPTPVSQAAGPATVASGAPISLSVSPTYPGATYVWSGPGGFSSTQQNPTTSTTTAGVARYTVNVSLGSCAYSSFVDVTVQAATDPVLALTPFGGPLCLGSSRFVSFTVTGSPFPSGNVVTAQLSDAAGSFTTPVSIGSGNFTGQGSGSLVATIPANTLVGSGYRIRLVASNPATVISNNNGSNLALIAPPAATASSNSPVPEGGTIELLGGPAGAGNTYLWTAQYNGGGNVVVSTAQNPQLANATPAQSGNYTLKVTNAAGCSSSATVAVTVTPAVPVTTLTLTALAGPLCAGSAYTLSYTAGGPNFGAGNTISAVLSNASGAFAASSPVIGSVSTTAAAAGTLGVAIPAATAAGSGYRIRLVSTAPAIVSNNNGSDLVISNLSAVAASSNSPVAAGASILLTATNISGATYAWTGPNGYTATGPSPTIANATAANAGTYSVAISLNGCAKTVSTTVVVSPVVVVASIQTSSLTGSFCAGSALSVAFTAANFTTGNVFTAQLSTASGSFGAPVNIGTLTGTASGTIAAVLPASTVAGTGYRVRVVGSQPATIGTDNGTNLTITNLGAVAAGSNSPVTAGTAITLTATGPSGATYAWTGPNGYAATGPNQTIANATAANAGTYSVTASLNGCSATATTTVVVNPVATVASIQTSPLTGSRCAGTSISVAFTAVNFTAGNVFTAQLSNASGSFGAPVSIGTLTGTASGTIAAVLPAATPAGSGYRIRVVGSQPATIGSDNGANLTVTASGLTTWLGAVNSNWFEPANWSCGQVPTSTSSVLIPGGLGTYPVLGAGAPTALNLTVASGAAFTLNGSFALLGNLVDNGTVSAGTGSLFCTGAAAQTLGGSSPLRFFNLTVNNAAGVALLTPLGVRRVLTLAAGNLASGGRLTLESDATGTALVVNPAGGGVVTGRATMQRFTAGSAGYRHYSSPMQRSANGLATTVQEFADDLPVFELNPAYNTVGGAAKPFPTLFEYDETRLTAAKQGFDDGYLVPGADEDLEPLRGYDAQTGPTTTVDISGLLQNGPVSRALTRGGFANSGWHLLGNPYPAPVDWDVVRALPGALTNVADAVYVYQPSGPYTGTYQSYVNGVGQNGGTKMLAAMQGFFLRATAPAASISFTNAVRTTGSASAARGASAAPRPMLRLVARNVANGTADETVVYFEAGAALGFVPRYDAAKVQLGGSGRPSVWSQLGTESFAIKGLPDLDAAPVVPLGVRVSTDGPHRLVLAGLANAPAGTQVWLEDRALNRRQNLAQDTAYAFTMKAGATAQRFYLHFAAAAPGGLTLGQLSARTSLYPNPANARVSLEMSGLREQGPVAVEVVNVLGQVVQRLSPRPQQGFFTETLDLRDLPTGVYLVRIYAREGTLVKRLLRE